MISLSRAYAGYLPGTIVQLDTPTETALVQQGFGTVSVGPVTPGNVSTTQFSGRVGIAAAGTAVVVTNPSFTTQTKFQVSLSNAAADSTATSVRATPAAGSVTFTLNAASTGVVALDWAAPDLSGLTAVN